MSRAPHTPARADVPACHRAIGAELDHEALITACRRTAAICDRATIALLIVAVPVLLSGVLP